MALEETVERVQFEPVGGPLHRLGLKFNLVTNTYNSLKLGLLLGWGFWFVLALVALATGYNPLSVEYLDMHVRLVVGIPLFFLAESIAFPRLRECVEVLSQSTIVPQDSRRRLAAAVARANRFNALALPEILCFIVAIAVTIFGPDLQFLPHPAKATSGLLAGMSWWSWLACQTLVRFLILRWVLRIAVWTYLLARIAHLPLALMPSHHDKTAGLGILLVTQGYFLCLIVAVSAIVSSGLAQQLLVQQIDLAQTLPLVIALIALNAIVFLGPLLAFTPKMMRSFGDGFQKYSRLSEGLVREFERKWLDRDNLSAEQLLEGSDISNHADLAGVMGLVSGMRFAPISLRLVMLTVGATLLPFLPLLLFKYRIVSLVRQLILNFAGF